MLTTTLPTNRSSKECLNRSQVRNDTRNWRTEYAWIKVKEPLDYNHNKTELTLEWHWRWLAKQTHKFHGELAVSKVPIPTTNLYNKHHYPVKTLIETGLDTSTKGQNGLSNYYDNFWPRKIAIARSRSFRFAVPPPAALIYGYGRGSGRQLWERSAPMADAKFNPVDQWLESLPDQNPLSASLERQISPLSLRSTGTDSEMPEITPSANTALSTAKTLQHAMENPSVEYLMDGQWLRFDKLTGIQRSVFDAHYNAECCGLSMYQYKWEREDYGLARTVEFVIKWFEKLDP